MSISETRKLALFDFDGTLTKTDAFIRFLSFSHGPIRFCLLMILASPVLFLYKANIISNARAKEKLFSLFYKGMDIAVFNRYVDRFIEQKLPGMLRIEAIERLNWHLAQKHEVVVVSANFDLLIEKWCKQRNIPFLCTCLDVKDNKLTGKFSGKNCYGAEKVNRIKLLYQLEQFDEIFAYGDSKGDLAMLEIAHRKYFKCFVD